MSSIVFTDVKGTSIAPPAPIVGIIDNFTDITGTNITLHTPDSCPAGAAWILAVGNPADATIQSNKLRIQDGTYNWCGYTIESGLSDCTIKVTMLSNWVNPCGGGIYFRDDGIDRLTAGMIRASNSCYIFNTNGSTLDSDTLTRDPDDRIDITVTLLGTSIIALFENITKSTSVTLTASTANNLTATKHGITFMAQFGEGTYDFFDDFIIA
jgi:hypothetical protein